MASGSTSLSVPVQLNSNSSLPNVKSKQMPFEFGRNDEPFAEERGPLLVDYALNDLKTFGSKDRNFVRKSAYWKLKKEICPGLTLIRCKRISISVTKCPLALLANFNITCVSEYRQFMSQSVPQMLLFK